MATVGFAPNFYFNQQSAGLTIYIAPGLLNGVYFPGQLVVVPPNAVTPIGLDVNGNIVFQRGAGITSIAVVVSGQVITSGNTINSQVFTGVPPNPFNTSFESSNGIISITDVRGF